MQVCTEFPLGVTLLVDFWLILLPSKIMQQHNVLIVLFMIQRRSANDCPKAPLCCVTNNVAGWSFYRRRKRVFQALSNRKACSPGWGPKGIYLQLAISHFYHFLQTIYSKWLGESKVKSKSGPNRSHNGPISPENGQQWRINADDDVLKWPEKAK